MRKKIVLSSIVAVAVAASTAAVLGTASASSETATASQPKAVATAQVKEPAIVKPRNVCGIGWRRIGVHYFKRADGVTLGAVRLFDKGNRRCVVVSRNPAFWHKPGWFLNPLAFKKNGDPHMPVRFLSKRHSPPAIVAGVGRSCTRNWGGGLKTAKGEFFWWQGTTCAN